MFELFEQTVPQPEEETNNPQKPVKNLERVFSKQLAPELRQETTRRIREIRRLPKTSKEARDTEILKDYRAKEIYEELRGNIFERIMDRQFFRGLEEQFAERAGVAKRDLIEKAQQDFETRLETILNSSPLTPEEQEQFLTEEAMSAMDLNDYLTVLKRLSGNFVTHMTRQGVREKTFASFSSYGSMGSGEFHNNFVEILKQGRLLSFLGGLEAGGSHLDDLLTGQIESARQFKPLISDEELVVDIWEGFKKTELGVMNNPPAEGSSIHFGLNEELGSVYGAEKGYDIYFYYPAEFIARNYFHKSKQAYHPEDELSRRAEGIYDNDVFVWNEGKGVPVDAGLVCIPENTMVDPETGSQYALDKKKRPLSNPEIAEQMDFVDKNIEAVLAALKELTLIRREKGPYFDPPEEFMARLGFASKEVFVKFFQEDGLGGYEDVEGIKGSFKRNYEKTGRTFKSAEKTVTSKEYWEEAFEKNPEIRPSKVLYYWRNMPFTTAVRPVETDYKELAAKKTFKEAGDLPNHSDYLARIEGIVKERVRSLLQSQSLEKVA